LRSDLRLRRIPRSSRRGRGSSASPGTLCLLTLSNGRPFAGCYLCPTSDILNGV
jgi:hypothetical protein